MTLDETAKLIEYICGIELRPAVPPGAVDAWADVLADIDAETAVATVKKIYRMHNDGSGRPIVNPYVIRRMARG